VDTGFRKRSCFNKKLERDDDSKKSQPALGAFSGKAGTGIPSEHATNERGQEQGEEAMMQLIQRVKAILLTPSTEWPVIEREPGSPSILFVNYVPILAAIPAISRFVGQSLIGGYTPILSGLLRAVIVYVATFAVVYLIACVIDLLAPRFGAQKNFDNALKLTVYSYTPVWLAGIFLLIPGLNFLVVLGLYGIYLLWRGLPVLMRVPDHRLLPYTAVVTACALVPAIVLVMI
jgi:hypothetical protein